jgi:hypothetical protein
MPLLHWVTIWEVEMRAFLTEAVVEFRKEFIHFRDMTLDNSKTH